MAGRRTVEHDQVSVAAPLELLHLAQHEDVLDAGRRRRDDVEHSGVGQPLRYPPQAVVVEVLDQCPARRDRPTADPAGALRSEVVAEHRLVVGEHIVGVATEQARQPGLALDVDDEHAQSGLGCRARQHSRYRCLPDTALAGNHQQPRGGEELQWIHAPSGGSNCAD